MIWTMPRPVLHWVGGLLGLGALTAFVLGAINAAERGGRLPGERAPGQPAGVATAINATDATPLAQERIEAPAKPAPKAVNTDDSDQEEEAAPPTNAIPPTKALNATPPVVTPAAPAVNATPAAPPADDEPPH